MSKNTLTTATTPAATTPKTLDVMAPDDATTPLVTPITASIPEGQKSPALDPAPNWSGSRSIAVSDDGTAYTFLGNNGLVYQGVMANLSPRALAFGYAFGAKQKSDSDGAKDKSKTAETAESLTSFPVHLADWHSPRVSGPREETATPLDLQVKTLLIAKLRPSKDANGKLLWNTLTSAVKLKKIKLTGFSGSADRLFERYFAVVKLALGLEPTEEQITTFKEQNTSAAEKALAEAIKRQAEAAELANADDAPWA